MTRRSVRLIACTLMGLALIQAPFVSAETMAMKSEPPADAHPARLLVADPNPALLSQGIVLIAFHTENLRMLPVYGTGALQVVPKLGHLHVSVDDATWHWVHSSEEPIVVQGLGPGTHKVLMELADPAHRVIDAKTVVVQIPPRPVLQ